MCTSVRFCDSEGNLFFGRNLDWSGSYGEKVIVTPRGYKTSWAFNNAIDDAQGDVRPAVIGMGIVEAGKPLYFDCANEYGLGIAGLNFPGFAEYEKAPIEDRTNVASYEFPYWACAHFKTVDEVEAGIKDLALVGLEIGGFPPSFLHWIIVDKDKALVVEYMADGLHVYHNDIDVLANQPTFPWHLENVRNYINVTSDVPEDTHWDKHELSAYSSGFGMLGLPGAFNSPSRFIRASYLNSHYPVQDSERGNVDRLFHILLGVSMVDGAAKMKSGPFEKTIYTCGYYQKTKTYYYNNYEDLSIKQVSLADYDLDSEALVLA